MNISDPGNSQGVPSDPEAAMEIGQDDFFPGEVRRLHENLQSAAQQGSEQRQSGAMQGPTSLPVPAQPAAARGADELSASPGESHIVTSNGM